VDPAANLRLKDVPVITYAKNLDAEAAQRGVDGRLVDGGIDLDALPVVADRSHAGGDGSKIVDGVHGEEVDLTDTEHGVVAVARPTEDDTEESSSSPTSVASEFLLSLKRESEQRPVSASTLRSNARDESTWWNSSLSRTIMTWTALPSPSPSPANKARRYLRRAVRVRGAPGRALPL
jgi:hypothetical protein